MALSVLTGQTALGSATATTVSGTYVSTPTQNNLLVAIAFTTSGTNGLTGWTNVIDIPFNTTQDITMFAKIAGAGESTTVTTDATTNSLKRLAIYEVSGAVSGSVAAATDAATGAAGSSVSSVAVTAITTTQNDEIVFTGVAWPAATSALSIDNSFTLPAATNDTRLGGAYKIVSTTYSAASPATWSWTTARVPGVVVASFKQAAGGVLVNGNFLAFM